MTFKTNLQRAIKNKGWTVRELAEKSGVKKRTIDMWLGNQEPEPRVFACMKTAKALGVSVEVLLTGKDIAGLNDSEAQVLSMFREIKAKQLVLGLLEAVRKNEKK